MPLSFGILLGLAVVVLGAILFWATSYRWAAKITLGIGVAITLVTLIAIVLAVSSPM